MNSFVSIVQYVLVLWRSRMMVTLSRICLTRTIRLSSRTRTLHARRHCRVWDVVSLSLSLSLSSYQGGHVTDRAVPGQREN